MPQQGTPSDDALQTFLSLDSKQQDKALALLSPEDKKALLAGLEARRTTQQPTSSQAPTSRAATAYDPLAAASKATVIAPRNWRERTGIGLSWLPAAGATVGGIAASETGPGAVAGAAVGGGAGKAAEQLGRRAVGLPAPPTSGEAAKEIGWEGLKQGLYELGGRAVAAVGGRAVQAVRGVKPPPVGETIAGTKMPETAGQAYGKKGGFLQTVEHYLSKTFLGGPLKATKEAQEAGARKILAKLSAVPNANPAVLAENWAQAREATRVLASPMYDSISKGPAKDMGPLADEILASGLPLSTKAKMALGKLSTGSQTATDLLAQGLGYKNTAEAYQKMGREVFESYVKKVGPAAGLETGATIGDALQARSELGELKATLRDPRDRMLMGDAWNKLDAMIEKQISPEQRTIKAEADLLWRRSYIMDRITKSTRKMERLQAPGDPPTILTRQFVTMVNDLGKEELTHAGGKVIRKTSDLEILFKDPADRKAMKELATFLNDKYSTMGGAGGISESIARIGVALEAVNVGWQAVTGQETAAARHGTYLAGLYGLSMLLARPGGAVMARELFRSQGAAATTAAIRIAGTILEHQGKDTETKGLPSPPPYEGVAP